MSKLDIFIEEKWYDIPFIPNYQISNTGKLKDARKDSIMSKSIKYLNKSWHYSAIAKEVLFDPFLEDLDSLIDVWRIDRIEDEKFKWVNGFDYKYIFSSKYRLFSFFGKYKGVHLMTPSVDSLGYHAFRLRNGDIKIDYRGHRLVGDHFIPNPKKLPFINHIDGDKLNNDISNLEWCDVYHNNKHAADTGLYNTKGENHYNSKLKDFEVISYRRKYATGNYNVKELSHLLKINRRTLMDCIRGITWGHIKPSLDDIVEENILKGVYPNEKYVPNR